MEKNNVKVMISEEKLAVRVRELAEEMNLLYKEEPLHLICILKGSMFFTCDLAKHLTMPVTIDFMQASSYGDYSESQGVKIRVDLAEDIKGKNVLVVEDIIDTGRTLKRIKENLLNRQPKSLKICTLLDKPSRRVEEICADYTGFTIEDYFVVGYGLDYAQKYRNLSYIGMIE